MAVFSDSDRSILKIAYAISALDGIVTQDELNAFRKVAEGFPGFCAGDEVTNTLFEEAIDTGNQLMALKKVYSDEEMLKALLAKTCEECKIIKQSHSAIKKAFVIWTAIALADHNYSDIERKAIKAMQAAFNAAPVNLACLLIANLVHASHDDDQIVSDTFLCEVEDSLKTISEIQLQMKTCNKERLAELQKSSDEISASLHEMILAEDN